MIKQIKSSEKIKWIYLKPNTMNIAIAGNRHLVFGNFWNIKIAQAIVNPPIPKPRIILGPPAAQASVRGGMDIRTVARPPKATNPLCHSEGI